MVLTSALRKFLLTLHVLSSLGWAGAVAVFVVTDIALTGSDPSRRRLLWLALQAAVWSLLVPLAFASLLTGVMLALGTVWGAVPALLDALQARAHPHRDGCAGAVFAAMAADD